MKSVNLSLGALALAAGLATTSVAQAPQGPPDGRPGMMRDGGQMTPERRAEMRQKMEQRREERARQMHDVLGIQPNQENAWNAFQAALKPPTPPAPPAANAAPLTTMQRLDQMLARSNERNAEVRKRVDATKKFYAALTPTQQKSFDALAQMRGERRGMMRERFGHEGGPGMGGPGMRGRGGPGGPPPG